MTRQGKARFEVWAVHLFLLLELRLGLTTMRPTAREICGEANQRRLELTMGYITYTQ